MPTINIELKKFAAVAQFASKKDVRKMLTGMLIEINSGTVRIVATNGAIMGVAIMHGQDERIAVCPASQWIIPPEAIAALCKIKLASITIELNSVNVTLAAYGSTTSWPLLTERYPDWRRVIGISSEPVAPGGYDPDLIARIGRAAQLARGSRNNYFAFEQHGAWSGTFHIDDQIAGVIMPLDRPTPFDEWTYKGIVS